MFTFSKLIAPFLLPPGIFLLLLLAALIYIRRRRKRAALSLMWILGLLIYLLSIRPVADALISPLELSYPGPGGAQPACEAIVVFGGGVALDMDGVAQPGGASALRAYRAFQIWRKSPGQIVLSGGSVHGEEWNTASVMATYLGKLGVPKDYMIIEQESRNTFENAQLSSRILKAREIESACLVTSAYHMPRAVKSMAVFDFKVVPVPADVRAYGGDYGWRHTAPDMHSLSLSALALHEYMGMLFYMLAYGV